MTSGDRFGIFSLPGFTGDPQFPEVVVKMVDARSFTGKFWFFHTGLTSLDYTLTVTDSETGAVRTYESPGPFCGGADTSAFTDHPASPPIPAPLALDGEWTGHVSLWGDWIHDCAADEDVPVNLFHVGNSVGGHLRTSCLGNLTLHGTLTGTSLTFRVWTASEELYATISGTASEGSIDVRNHSQNFGMSLVLMR